MPIDLNATLVASDPDIAAQIDHEILRQHEGLEMIASENFVSRAVIEAAGTVFTNKYAEGYPGRRYYGGCEFADVVENIARDRAKQIFGADHANVQPHSGSQANAAAYMSIINPGDTVLGLDLAHGGHLTHGHKLNFSGKLYRIVGYYLMIDMAHFAGLVAGGVHPSPVPHAHIVTTTTHKTLRGPRAGLILCQEQFAAAVDRSVFPGQQGGPLVHVLAGKAVAFREALDPGFKQY